MRERGRVTGEREALLEKNKKTKTNGEMRHREKKYDCVEEEESFGRNTPIRLDKINNLSVL